MKKIGLFFLSVLLVFSLCGCGNVLFVQKADVSSEIYSEREISSAMNVALWNFFRDFDGCSMKTIRYAGDEKCEASSEWAARQGADEAIILLSDFVVGPKSDGSLSPFSSHTNWQWILVRKHGGPWKLATCGYG